MKKILACSAQALRLCLVIVALAGCAATTEKTVDLVWPLPPEQPRIKFIKSLGGPQSQETKSFFDVMFGKKVQRFGRPSAVAADAADRIYVTDSASLIVFDKQTGKVDFVTLKGGAKIKNITGIAVANDGSMIYVSDNVSHKVFGLDREGNLKIAIGSTAGELVNPIGLAIDQKRNRLYVADGKKNQVLAYDLQGKHVFTMGEPGTEKGQFNIPYDIAVNSEGNIYITDMGNFRIQIFSPEGKFVSSFGEVGDRPGFFQRPKGIAVDRHDYVYVVDNVFNTVQIFNKDNNLLLAWGEGGYGPGQIMSPIDIFADDKDRIYIVSQAGKRVNIYQLLTYEEDAKQKDASSEPK